MQESDAGWTIEIWLGVIAVITPVVIAVITSRRPIKVITVSSESRPDANTEGSRSLLASGPFAVLLTGSLFIAGLLMIGTALYGSGLLRIIGSANTVSTQLNAFAIFAGMMCIVPIVDVTVGQALAEQKPVLWSRIISAYRILALSTIGVMAAGAIALSLDSVDVVGFTELTSGEKWLLFALAGANILILLLNLKSYWVAKIQKSNLVAVDIVLCCSLLLYPVTFMTGQMVSDENRSTAATGKHAIILPPEALRYSASDTSSISVTIEEPVVVRVLGQPENGYIQIDWDGLTGFVTEHSLVETELELSSRGTIIGPTTKGQMIADYAARYIGYPFVSGTHGPASFDSPGFTYWVMLQVLRINIGNTLWTQAASGTPVSRTDLQIGDLVFFQDTHTVGLSHVGIFIGDGNFIHAQDEFRGVTVSSIESDYYGSRWYGAVRVV